MQQNRIGLRVKHTEPDLSQCCLSTPSESWRYNLEHNLCDKFLGSEKWFNESHSLAVEYFSKR